ESNFGSAIAFRADWKDFPTLNGRGDVGEFLVACIAESASPSMSLRQIGRQPLRQQIRDCGGNLLARVLTFGVHQLPRDVVPRQERNTDRLLLAPVGRNLQDRGAGKAAMREEDGFLKRCLAAGNACVSG